MKKVIPVVLLIQFSLLVFACHVIPSAYFLTRDNHFIWGGMLYFLTTLFTSRRPLLVNSRKVYFIIMYIPLLFYTSVGVYAYFNGSPDPMPVWVFSNLLFFLGFYLAPRLELLRKGYLTAATLAMMFVLGKMILMPNWLNYCSTQRASVQTNISFPPVLLTDKNGEQVDYSQWKGKTIVLDLWSSFCWPCIRKFPDFEKVYQQYKSDPDVIITAINLPAKGESFESREKFTDSLRSALPHTFPHLFTDTSAWKTLNIDAVPQYLIINKEGVIKYAGSLNTGKADFYNNIHSLIRKYAGAK